MKNRINDILLYKQITIDSLVEKTGISQSYLSRMIAGKRNISLKNLTIIADALDVSASELIESPWQDIAISGFVGVNSTILPFDDLEDIGNQNTVSVPTIFGDDLVALVINGNAMWPRYYNGEKIIYRRLSHITKEMYFKECIIQVSNGPLYIKILQPIEKSKMFRLKSHNMPDIENVSIDWIGEIKGRF